MTAHPFDRALAGRDGGLVPAGDGHGLRGTALVTVLVILFVVAAAVIATAEWIAPATVSAVPG